MRPIDADALNEVMYHEAFETDSNMQKWDSGCWIRYKMFENAIRNAPTIEAEPKWTPCTEALPVTEDYVLCTTEKKNGDRSVVRGYYTGSVWACGMNSNVVAWMPLPEPYKGENV